MDRGVCGPFRSQTRTASGGGRRQRTDNRDVKGCGRFVEGAGNPLLAARSLRPAPGFYFVAPPVPAAAVSTLAISPMTQSVMSLFDWKMIARLTILITSPRLF